MNEENKEILKAEAVVKEDSNQIMAYKIEDNIYVFANHKDNISSQTINDGKKFIDRRHIVDLIYCYDRKINKKSLIGFCVCNTVYINEILCPSTLNNSSIYIERGYLIINKLLYPALEEESVIRFDNAVNERIAALEEKKVRQQAIKKPEKQIKYNEEDTYEMKIVLDRLGIIIKSFVIEGEEFLLDSGLTNTGKRKILNLDIGSIIKTGALIDNNNIVGIVIFNVIYVKSSCDTDKCNEIILQKPDCNIKVRIIDIENKINDTIAFVDPVPKETTDFSYATFTNTKSAQAPPTKITSSDANTAYATFAETTSLEPVPTETTRLINSSAANLKELNSKRCNIL